MKNNVNLISSINHPVWQSILYRFIRLLYLLLLMRCI